MDKKVVVIFIEGDTEVEFYREFVKIVRTHCGGRLNCSVEIVNASGIGQYKRKVLNIFCNRIKPKYQNAQFHIALCYDQDVFELEKNPPINWKDVTKLFYSAGAKKVQKIKAVNAIEDWFLYDIEGVLQYLHLPRNTKIQSGSGADKLKDLFKRAQKIYIKGAKNGNFLKALNMEKILLNICPNIAPLCRLLGLNCQNQKKCSSQIMTKVTSGGLSHSLNNEQSNSKNRKGSRRTHKST